MGRTGVVTQCEDNNRRSSRRSDGTSCAAPTPPFAASTSQAKPRPISPTWAALPGATSVEQSRFVLPPTTHHGGDHACNRVSLDRGRGAGHRGVRRARSSGRRRRVGCTPAWRASTPTSARSGEGSAAPACADTERTPRPSPPRTPRRWCRPPSGCVARGMATRVTTAGRCSDPRVHSGTVAAGGARPAGR
jgi:hypothetical protein